MRYDPANMRLMVSLRPDSTFPFEKPYSWAIQAFVESEGDWYNVHFRRSDTHEEAWAEAKKKADEIELSETGKITQPKKRLKLTPSVKGT
jgi:hypothetical protein